MPCEGVNVKSRSKPLAAEAASEKADIRSGYHASVQKVSYEGQKRWTSTTVDTANLQALALYERLGFKAVSEWITFRRPWQDSTSMANRPPAERAPQ